MLRWPNGAFAVRQKLFWMGSGAVIEPVLKLSETTLCACVCQRSTECGGVCVCVCVADSDVLSTNGKNTISTRIRLKGRARDR